MTNFTRTLLTATLIFGLAGSAQSQDASQTAAETSTTAASETTTTDSTAPETAAEPAAATRDLSSYEIRNQFSNVLRQSPSEVASILVLDPGLLSNEPFMSGYPAIAEFVAEHPEVRRNPRFYLGDFAAPRRESAADEIFDAFALVLTVGLIGFAIMWLIRTIIEQKRWNRLSKQQSEVHNKILDRFGTSSELLDYVKSPAGTKFLESAPIPLHAEPPSTYSRPMTRVIWSVQIGVIVAAAALGMLVVSMRLDEDAAEGMFAMGAILMSIGLGFVGSAAVSLLVSRRLGLWDGRNAADGRPLDAGEVR